MKGQNMLRPQVDNSTLQFNACIYQCATNQQNLTEYSIKEYQHMYIMNLLNIKY